MPRRRGGRLPTAHYVTHPLGAVRLPVGIYGSISGASWTAPVVGTGSVLVLLALLLFAINLFRRVPRTSTTEALQAARVP